MRLSQEPRFSHAIPSRTPPRGREEYRQLVLQVLGGDYIFQYRYDGALLVILRVFHAREAR